MLEVRCTRSQCTPRSLELFAALRIPFASNMPRLQNGLCARQVHTKLNAFAHYVSGTAAQWHLFVRALITDARVLRSAREAAPRPAGSRIYQPVH
jgi:hypothetical protein